MDQATEQELKERAELGLSTQEGTPAVFSQKEAEGMTQGEAERWAKYPDKLAAHQASTPKKVEEVDRLRAENLQLKVMSIDAQLEMLRQQRHVLLIAMEGLQKGLETKYGINLRTHQIRSEDGAIVPINGAGR